MLIHVIGSIHAQQSDEATRNPDACIEQSMHVPSDVVLKNSSTERQGKAKKSVKRGLSGATSRQSRHPKVQKRQRKPRTNTAVTLRHNLVNETEGLSSDISELLGWTMPRAEPCKDGWLHQFTSFQVEGITHQASLYESMTLKR
eukprot:CAMPEP_0201516064 /NCGR_PEP_ID=MMETSP0161_2-20130828/7473_1 /ASSEMBLY_ACC=CAM_ASM_000251 /TAXON_ID=180227 /ORGANISM="Neoparamoeba aestuarina, Strain SoJaBio B1-5/56/2" /LENGTH=143 /DNA_ID=CAMNT_0047913063 /DNA_START=388 /DNA_END=819 /DNA_ORIENTATION=+